VKRVLGLDVGDVRIGVAISDELRITARGLFTLIRTNIKKDTQSIIDTVSANDCSLIIIGLPLNLSGQDSVQTEKVREFSKKLENKLVSNAMPDVKVILYDERFTTVLAEQAMKDQGVKNSKIKEAVDRQAAVVMLDDWMRANPNYS